MKTTYVAGLAALLLLAACGSESSDPADPAADDPSSPVVTPTVVTPTAMPTDIPAAAGEVTTGGPVTVLDDGDGAELCLGGTLDSLPPQCGGPRLIGWDWADHEGDFEDVSGVKWGEFVVTGTFDGADLTPSEVIPAVEYDAPPLEDEDLFTTPCEEPVGGWVADAATTTQEALDSATRLARRLPEFGQLWVDLSTNPALDDPDGLEKEIAMSDPEFTILNVSVTGDPAEAEAAIREVWGGPLCVSEAVLTARELRRIGNELGDLPGVLGWGGESYPLDASVMFDDGTIQAWADEEYGAGTVEISSALQPA